CAAIATSVAVAVPAVASTSPPASVQRQTMLVVLRTSHVPRSLPAARAVAAATQASVAGVAVRIGAAVVARTSVPNTLTVRVTGAQAGVLAADAFVAQVLPETTIPGPPIHPPVLTMHRGGRHQRHRRLSGSCGTLHRPQLNPEALRNINDVPGATLGFDGKGVTVAFLADGLQIANTDFKR